VWPQHLLLSTRGSTRCNLYFQEADREEKFQARKAQKKAAEAGMSKVKAIKKGQQVEGTVKSIQPFGAFVEIAEAGR
jgi:ribosomal protein S1